jgi:DNA-binding XRE family transcriptional regulator
MASEAALPVKNRLKVLRAERDWSQQDLADKLGVSRQTINAIETEKYDPRRRRNTTQVFHLH